MASPAEWIQNGRRYRTDVIHEYRKVHWPTQREYVGGTVGVLVVVGVVTVVLGVVDFGLNQILRLVLP